MGWKRAFPTPAQGVAPLLSVVWVIKNKNIFKQLLFFPSCICCPSCSEQGQEPQAPRSVPLSASCDLHGQNGSTWMDPTLLMDAFISFSPWGKQQAGILQPQP